MPEVKQLVANAVPLTVVTVANDRGMTKLLEQNPVPKIADFQDTDGFAVFYREIDYSATAYFYLDSPTHDLPALPDKQARIAGLPAKYD